MGYVQPTFECTRFKSRCNGCNSRIVIEQFKILKCIKRKVLELEYEEGTRGGISDIFNRYIKTNNKYLKSYGPKQESKHIIYLDANNLYGYAKPKFLPASGFKWIDPKEFDMNEYTSNSSKGCAVEINLFFVIVSFKSIYN